MKPFEININFICNLCIYHNVARYTLYTTLFNDDKTVVFKKYHPLRSIFKKKTSGLIEMHRAIMLKEEEIKKLNFLSDNDIIEQGSEGIISQYNDKKQYKPIGRVSMFMKIKTKTLAI